MNAEEKFENREEDEDEKIVEHFTFANDWWMIVLAIVLAIVVVNIIGLYVLEPIRRWHVAKCDEDPKPMPRWVIYSLPWLVPMLLSIMWFFTIWGFYAVIKKLMKEPYEIEEEQRRRRMR
jgi:uncharacterized protein YneF (UPF0154 family)